MILSAGSRRLVGHRKEKGKEISMSIEMEEEKSGKPVNPEVSKEIQLKAYFRENEIEWVPLVKSPSNKKIKLLPRIKRHCIITRLDEVFGQDNWKDEYEAIGEIAVLCRLSVRIQGEWIVKSDGAERDKQEDVLVAAFRKAAEKWGIGLYLNEIQEEIRIVPIDEGGSRYFKSGSMWYRYNNPILDYFWLPEIEETEELIALKIEIEELVGELYDPKTYKMPGRLTVEKAKKLIEELNGIKEEIAKNREKGKKDNEVIAKEGEVITEKVNTPPENDFI